MTSSSHADFDDFGGLYDLNRIRLFIDWFGQLEHRISLDPTLQARLNDTLADNSTELYLYSTEYVDLANVHC